MELNRKILAHVERRFATALRGYRMALIRFQCPYNCGRQIRVDYRPNTGAQRQVVITGCCEGGRAKATEIIGKHIQRKGGRRM